MPERISRRDTVRRGLAAAGLLALPEWAIPALAQGETLVPPATKTPSSPTAGGGVSAGEGEGVVVRGQGARRGEAEAAARSFLAGLDDTAVAVHGFRDGFFPSQHAEIKEAFEQLKRAYDPSLVLTHYRADLHQDHRLIAELTHNTFRDHLVWVKKCATTSTM